MSVGEAVSVGAFIIKDEVAGKENEARLPNDWPEC